MPMSVDGGRGGSGAGLQSPSSTPGPDAVWRRLQQSAGGLASQIRAYHPPAPQYPVYSNNQGNYRPSPPPMEQPGPVEPVRPPAPSIEDFLGGDSGYQTQMRQFGEALSNMQGDVTRRKGQYETDYNLSKKAMDDQRVLDLKNLEADYGARGVLRSGLYSDAVGKYEGEFNTRSTDLARREQDALTGLTTELGQFQSKQGLDQQAAREAAIARRAAQYGL